MPFFSKLTKNDSDKAVEVAGNSSASDASKTSVGEARNWYSDRYESLVVQRNILLLISLASIIATVVAAFVVLKVTVSKDVIPMLVEVEEKTGFTNVVNPKDNAVWTSDKALNEYFLLKYLHARETYNVASYIHNYNTVVRVLSTPQVYNQFQKTLSGSNSPVARYGSNDSTNLRIRSIQYFSDRPNGDKNVQVRFTIIESNNGTKYNKIVNILYNFIQLQLTFNERMINPLGFQVKSYAVADDVDINV